MKECVHLSAEELAEKLAQGWVIRSGPHATKEECLAACLGDPGQDCASAPTIEPGVTYGPFVVSNLQSHWFRADHPGGNYRVLITTFTESPTPSDEVHTFTGTCDNLTQQDGFFIPSIGPEQCWERSAGPGDVYIRFLASDGTWTYTVRYELGNCP